MKPWVLALTQKPTDPSHYPLQVGLQSATVAS